MTEQEKQNLLLKINELPSSNWVKLEKDRIFSQYKYDTEFKKKVIEAFINKQLQETAADPLEDKVCDQNGKYLANRAWPCHAKNCSYQPFRGNCAQLKIEVSRAESWKLIGIQKYACLKHFSVFREPSDYCHNYFKEHKKLPTNAILNIKGPAANHPTLKAALSLPAEPQPGLENLETVQTKGKKTSLHK